MNQETNQTRKHRKQTFGAEINKPKLLRCWDRQTHGALVPRSWILGLGFCSDFEIMIFGFGILRKWFGCLRKEKKKREELFGEELPWDRIWKKKKRKKKKGEKERRKKMVYRNSSLRDLISRWTPRGKSVNSNLIRTWKPTLKDLIYSPKSSLLDLRC